jgi:putative heme-binding domain-containing protein
VGARLSPAQILESVLQPSKVIDPRYVWYVAETVGGDTHAGILAERTSDAVVLLDAQNARTRVTTAQLRRLVPDGKSAMPELLLSSLTAEEAADLLAFLASLR